MSLAKKLTRKIKNIDSYLFEAVSTQLEAEQAEKEENQSWEKYGYKIYPSSIKSIIQCPKKLIEEDVHKALYFSHTALVSMELGKEFHTACQNTCKRIPGFLMKPDYSYYRSLFGDEEANKMEAKLVKVWPEVPIYDPISGFSMRMDLPLANPPRIVDIKSIGQEDTIKNKKTGEIEFGCWDKLKATLPKEEHKLQDAFYIFFSNLFQLFPEKVTKGGIAYINSRMGNEVNRFETEFDYTEQMDTIFHAFRDRVAAHRTAWIESKLCIPCEYTYCNGIH